MQPKNDEKKRMKKRMKKKPHTHTGRCGNSRFGRVSSLLTVEFMSVHQKKEERGFEARFGVWGLGFGVWGVEARRESVRQERE